MIEVTLKIENLDELHRVFQQAPVRMTREISMAVRRSVMRIERNVKREAPVSKGEGGGNLRQNIRSGMIGPATGVVNSEAPYSGFVEKGTKPHIIMPRSKQVLARRTGGTKAGGQYQIFGKLVHHPGTKANPFFQRGVDNSARDVNGYFIRAIVSAIGKPTP